MRVYIIEYVFENGVRQAAPVSDYEIKDAKLVDLKAVSLEIFNKVKKVYHGPLWHRLHTVDFGKVLCAGLVEELEIE